MKKFRFEQGDMFMSNDIAEDPPFQRDPSKYFDVCLEHATKNQPRCREYIELFGKLRQLKGYGVLEAHGFEQDGKWAIADGENGYYVQDWIDRHDGRYAGLIIHCCNPGACTPFVRKSMLVIPDKRILLYGSDDYSWAAVEKNPIFSLIHPDRGEITDYTIDHEINRLRFELDESEARRAKLPRLGLGNKEVFQSVFAEVFGRKPSKAATTRA